MTYGDLLSLYGAHRGLKRLIIPVPVLSPGLSGWWLYLFTPKQATVGRQLAESLRHPTTVTSDAAAARLPDHPPHRHRGGLRPRVRRRGGGLLGDPVERGARRPSGGCIAEFRARGPLRRLSHAQDRMPSRGGVRSDRMHRRRERLVRVRHAVGHPRLLRHPARRPGSAARPSRPVRAHRGRRARMVARRDGRLAVAAAAQGRDGHAGRGLAPVRARARRRRHDRATDGDVRREGVAGQAVLVRGAAVPPLRVHRHAQGHRARVHRADIRARTPANCPAHMRVAWRSGSARANRSEFVAACCRRWDAVFS